MNNNSNNKNKGFTLVEVIVVSVIVAVLAAVAIPLYIGYVDDARQSAANNEAQNFATAVSAGINSGATAISCAAGTINGPQNITWTMPASWTGGTAPKYCLQSGVSLSTTGNLLNSGGSVTANVRGKTSASYAW